MRATFKLLSHLLLASSFAITANVMAEDKKAEAPLHKFSAAISLDIVSEPQAESQEGLTDKSYKKIRSLLVVPMSYTFNSKYAVSYTPEFRYFNGHFTDGYALRPDELNYSRGLVTLMVKNVLTEQDHGIKLDAGYVRRINNVRVVPSHGNHRLRLAVAKKLSDVVSINVNNDIMKNVPKRTTNTSWKFLYNPISTITYTLSEKLTFMQYYDWNFYYYEGEVANRPRQTVSTESRHILSYQLEEKINVGSNFQFTYISNHDRAQYGNRTSNFAVAPYMTYTINDVSEVSFEISWTTHESNDVDADGLAFRKNFIQYPDLAISYSLSLF